MLSIVFRMQLVGFRKLPTSMQEDLKNVIVVYEQVIGITTGLICATQIANLFLHGMDLLLTSWTSELINSSRVFLYKRYIDDVLIGHHVDVSQSELEALLNSFHADIKVTIDRGDASGNVAFLDLLIQPFPEEDRIHYSTCRKPTNLYCYLPWKSACPTSIEHAVIDAELVRIQPAYVFSITR